MALLIGTETATTGCQIAEQQIHTHVVRPPYICKVINLHLSFEESCLISPTNTQHDPFTVSVLSLTATSAPTQGG